MNDLMDCDIEKDGDFVIVKAESHDIADRIRQSVEDNPALLGDSEVTVSQMGMHVRFLCEDGEDAVLVFDRLATLQEIARDE